MKFMKRMFALVIAVTMVISSGIATAQELPTGLKLPAAVSSNMVLQQNATVNVWGWAKPKAKVTVTASWTGDKGLTVKADKEGKWIVPLATPAASYQPQTIKIATKGEEKSISNILIGEVWLCAGQSNMEYRVEKELEMRKELNGELSENIRLLCTGRISAELPQEDIPGVQWTMCTPEDLGAFSAVAYGFGKELQAALDVPIGLIDASYGGTFIEGWMSRETIDADPKLLSDCKAVKHKKWKEKECHLYNANIYPIRHTTVAGTLWYQGCANVASRPRNYGHSLEVLIGAWRQEFRNPTMPFYIVQIAPHTYGNIKGAQVREAQAATADKVEHCELVATMDQQEIPGDIHPRLKGDVAHRLAQCALGEHYGKQVGCFRSPAYESMSVEGNAVRVKLKNVPTSIVKRGEGRINGFQLGQPDEENPKRIAFVLAEAEIHPDNTILVTAEGITNPTAVRYCFNEDVGNLFSAEGLPVAPFRSDKNNSSHGVRPYVEKPSEIAITFEGNGYTMSTFTEGAHLWPNLKQVLSDEYPKEFEGFQMLVNNSVKKVKTPGGKITAHADGRVYCIVRNTSAFQKIEYKTDWRLIVPTWLKAIKPDGGKIGSQFIAYKNVRAGEVVELPRVKDHYSVFVLAKTINYVPVEE